MAGVALRYIQEAVDRGLATTLDAGLQIEADLFAKVFQTEDVREGVEAFAHAARPGTLKVQLNMTHASESNC
jgi:enoyl-CoA hydratase